MRDSRFVDGLAEAAGLLAVDAGPDLHPPGRRGRRAPRQEGPTGRYGLPGISGYMSVGAVPGRRQAGSGSWPGSKISAWPRTSPPR
jgi:hypothetical protein